MDCQVMEQQLSWVKSTSTQRAVMGQICLDLIIMKKSMKLSGMNSINHSHENWMARTMAECLAESFPVTNPRKKQFHW